MPKITRPSAFNPAVLTFVVADDNSKELSTVDVYNRALSFVSCNSSMITNCVKSFNEETKEARLLGLSFGECFYDVVWDYSIMMNRDFSYYQHGYEDFCVVDEGFITSLALNIAKTIALILTGNIEAENQIHKRYIKHLAQERKSCKE